jgi:hypothetical protein
MDDTLKDIVFPELVAHAGLIDVLIQQAKEDDPDFEAKACERFDSRLGRLYTEYKETDEFIVLSREQFLRYTLFT